MRFCVAGLASAFFTLRAFAAPALVSLPASAPFPENIASTPDGTLYASSITDGGIVRAAPGAATASPWIPPGAYGTRSTFGLLADAPTDTLYVCSNDASIVGILGPTTTPGAFLKQFDLRTGQGKASMQFPPGPAICNDIARSPDGTLYLTNTAAPQLLRLQPNATKLDVWLTDPRLAGGLDGIAIGADGNLYVDTYQTGELFRIAISNGVAGTVTKLATSRSLIHPDAIRPYKGGFLMVEGGGTLDRVTITADSAKIETIANLEGPTGVTITGGAIWTSEGRLALLNKGAKPAQMPVFYLERTALPQ